MGKLTKDMTPEEIENQRKRAKRNYKKRPYVKKPPKKYRDLIKLIDKQVKEDGIKNGNSLMAINYVKEIIKEFYKGENYENDINARRGKTC